MISIRATSSNGGQYVCFQGTAENCTYFSKERYELLNIYFSRGPNLLKFKELLRSENEDCLIRLSKFVKIIMDKFS